MMSDIDGKVDNVWTRVGRAKGIIEDALRKHTALDEGQLIGVERKVLANLERDKAHLARLIEGSPLSLSQLAQRVWEKTVCRGNAQNEGKENMATTSKSMTPSTVKNKIVDMATRKAYIKGEEVDDDILDLETDSAWIRWELRCLKSFSHKAERAKVQHLRAQFKRLSKDTAKVMKLEKQAGKQKEMSKESLNLLSEYEQSAQNIHKLLQFENVEESAEKAKAGFQNLFQQQKVSSEGKMQAEDSTAVSNMSSIVQKDVSKSADSSLKRKLNSKEAIDTKRAKLEEERALKKKKKLEEQKKKEEERELKKRQKLEEQKKKDEERELKKKQKLEEQKKKEEERELKKKQKLEEQKAKDEERELKKKQKLEEQKAKEEERELKRKQKLEEQKEKEEKALRLKEDMEKREMDKRKRANMFFQRMGVQKVARPSPSKVSGLDGEDVDLKRAKQCPYLDSNYINPKALMSEAHSKDFESKVQMSGPYDVLKEEFNARYRAKKNRRRLLGQPPPFSRRSKPVVKKGDDAETQDVLPSTMISDDSRDEVEAVFWRRKLLQFCENEKDQGGSGRPPYYGSFSQKSQNVTARRPFAKDPTLDYEVDSADEWEEPDDGESISNSDVEDCLDNEEGCDDDNQSDGFVVEDGYLSEDERGYLHEYEEDNNDKDTNVTALNDLNVDQKLEEHTLEEERLWAKLNLLVMRCTRAGKRIVLLDGKNLHHEKKIQDVEEKAQEKKIEVELLRGLAMHHVLPCEKVCVPIPKDECVSDKNGKNDNLKTPDAKIAKGKSNNNSSTKITKTKPFPKEELILLVWSLKKYTSHKLTEVTNAFHTYCSTMERKISKAAIHKKILELCKDPSTDLDVKDDILLDEDIAKGLEMIENGSMPEPQIPLEVNTEKAVAKSPPKEGIRPKCTLDKFWKSVDVEAKPVTSDLTGTNASMTSKEC